MHILYFHLTTKSSSTKTTHAFANFISKVSHAQFNFWNIHINCLHTGRERHTHTSHNTYSHHSSLSKILHTLNFRKKQKRFSVWARIFHYQTHGPPLPILVSSSSTVFLRFDSFGNLGFVTWASVDCSSLPIFNFRFGFCFLFFFFKQLIQSQTIIQHINRGCWLNL